MLFAVELVSPEQVDIRVCLIVFSAIRALERVRA